MLAMLKSRRLELDKALQARRKGRNTVTEGKAQYKYKKEPSASSETAKTLNKHQPKVSQTVTIVISIHHTYRVIVSEDPVTDTVCL